MRGAPTKTQAVARACRRRRLITSEGRNLEAAPVRQSLGEDGAVGGAVIRLEAQKGRGRLGGQGLQLGQGQLDLGSVR